MDFILLRIIIRFESFSTSRRGLKRLKICLCCFNEESHYLIKEEIPTKKFQLSIFISLTATAAAASRFFIYCLAMKKNDDWVKSAEWEENFCHLHPLSFNIFFILFPFFWQKHRKKINFNSIMKLIWKSKMRWVKQQVGVW